MPVYRRVRQVGPVPAARVAARRDGRPHAGERLDPRGHDGDGRRLPGRPLHAAVRAGARGAVAVAIIGGITALLAALIALTQNDLKRVLAYSTVSQLGYMFLALGSAAAGQAFAAAAVTAAIFHLFTHAFFKALLFLSAGNVMHAMGNVIDMRQFSGLRKVLPVTHITFLCGALALAGFPFFSGFWSKDEIFGLLLNGTHHGDHRRCFRPCSGWPS